MPVWDSLGFEGMGWKRWEVKRREIKNDDHFFWQMVMQPTISLPFTVWLVDYFFKYFVDKLSPKAHLIHLQQAVCLFTSLQTCFYTDCIIMSIHCSMWHYITVFTRSFEASVRQSRQIFLSKITFLCHLCRLYLHQSKNKRVHIR